MEVIFSYPGLGTVLYNAVRQFDYFLLQGIILTIVLSVTIATLILDFIYPLFQMPHFVSTVLIARHPNAPIPAS